ncbi:MAG: hypothetical protein IJJ13_04365 [Lachnospiraceae bacterium]|nr:hypothetical protein [Lachnospiraceae bacterium]
MIKRENMVDYHAYIRINDIHVRCKHGNLLLSIDLNNISGRAIKQATFVMHAVSANEQPVLLDGQESLTFTLSDLKLEAAMRMSTPFRCAVEGAPAGIEIETESVVFADGDQGPKQRPHKKLYFYDALDPERAKEKECQEYLQRFSDRALCFAEKRNDGWLCTCGRLNRSRDDFCMECLADRKELFAHCTKEAVKAKVRKERGRFPFSLKRRG